jgi:hypothetical protein
MPRMPYTSNRLDLGILGACLVLAFLIVCFYRGFIAVTSDVISLIISLGKLPL